MQSRSYQSPLFSVICRKLHLPPAAPHSGNTRLINSSVGSNSASERGGRINYPWIMYVQLGSSIAYPKYHHTIHMYHIILQPVGDLVRFHLHLMMMVAFVDLI